MFALSVRLSVQAAHDFRQPFEEEICIIATEAQRRTDLQAVAKATGRANQHALKLQVIDNATRQLRIRISAVWPGKLDGVEQSGAANVGDGREILGQLAQSGTQIVPVALGVVHQGLLFNHLQYREAHGGSHRVTAKGVEVLGLFAERLQNSRARDHRGHGKTVPHWLAERDDIRLHTVTLEAPEMRACPTKARLDFIGDKQSAPGLYAGYRLGQKSRRIGENAVAGKNGIHQ